MAIIASVVATPLALVVTTVAHAPELIELVPIALVPLAMVVVSVAEDGIEVPLTLVVLGKEELTASVPLVLVSPV